LQSFVDEERTAKVGLAIDGDAGFGFDVLRQELREDDLLGEKFGADGDFGLRRTRASRQEANKVQKIKNVKESERSTPHVR
jgi:hypothetical protein